MVCKLIWTDKALQDLKGICDYIAKDSSAMAKQVGEAILRHVQILEEFPDIGPRFPRIFGKYREVICFKYRIFYRVDKDSRTVNIMRIWHGSQDESDLDLK